MPGLRSGTGACCDLCRQNEIQRLKDSKTSWRSRQVSFSLEWFHNKGRRSAHGSILIPALATELLQRFGIAERFRTFNRNFTASNGKNTSFDSTVSCQHCQLLNPGYLVGNGSQARHALKVEHIVPKRLAWTLQLGSSHLWCDVQQIMSHGIMSHHASSWFLTGSSLSHPSPRLRCS